MPQRSYGFAVGQVCVLEQSLISRQALGRLVASDSVDELARILTELGWGEAKSKSDIEQLADAHVREAATLVKNVTPEPEVTDCFLFKYDILNLKVLVKSRTLGLTAGELSPCGTLNPEMLRRAVWENNYRNLPEILSEAMNAIEKRIAINMDPLFVDATLDQAMYKMIEHNLRKVKNADIRQFFSDKADLTNLLIALRCARMKSGAQLAAQLFVDGGKLQKDKLAGVADEPERAIRLTEKMPYRAMVRDAVQSDNRKTGLAQLEKRMDDHLLSLIKSHRYEVTSIMPVIGYLIAREREAAAVRLLAIGKNAKVPQEALLWRLRELYA